MSPYPEWKLPSDVPINELSSKQSTEYRDWFLSNIEPRLSILDTAISSTPGYSTWNGSTGPTDLSIVSMWLGAKVRELWPAALATPTTELTSVGWDVGLHLARVLISNLDWKWEQYLISRRMVDFGHMVVRGHSGAYRNPLRQANVIVRRLHRNAWTPEEMIKQYDYAEAENNGQIHPDTVAKF